MKISPPSLSVDRIHYRPQPKGAKVCFKLNAKGIRDKLKSILMANLSHWDWGYWKKPELPAKIKLHLL